VRGNEECDDQIKKLELFYSIDHFTAVFIDCDPVSPQQVSIFCFAILQLVANGCRRLFGHVAVNTITLSHVAHAFCLRAKMTGAGLVTAHAFLRINREALFRIFVRIVAAAAGHRIHLETLALLQQSHLVPVYIFRGFVATKWHKKIAKGIAHLKLKTGLYFHFIVS
jgi:hypothetical protein